MKKVIDKLIQALNGSGNAALGISSLGLLGTQLDNLAEYLGLKGGLSGSIANYLAEKNGFNDPNFEGNAQYTGYRDNQDYKDKKAFYKFRDDIMKKYNISKSQAAELAEEYLAKGISDIADTSPKEASEDIVDDPYAMSENTEISPDPMALREASLDDALSFPASKRRDNGNTLFNSKMPTEVKYNQAIKNLTNDGFSPETATKLAEGAYSDKMQFPQNNMPDELIVKNMARKFILQGVDPEIAIKLALDVLNQSKYNEQIYNTDEFNPNDYMVNFIK